MGLLLCLFIFSAGVRIQVVPAVPSRVMRKFVCRLWLNEVSQQ